MRGEERRGKEGDREQKKRGEGEGERWGDLYKGRHDPHERKRDWLKRDRNGRE